jgi:glycolate oxidase FAD binding subunit
MPSSYDVALSMAGLRRVLDHEPDDMTVTVDAGVRIADLQAALAERGQWLPVDVAGNATVGGALAVSARGPLQHAYGTMRDWVIGLRVAHVDGSISKSGGRVVKNVAGYDMHKLHIGALGTLGVITQATFKLATVPQHAHGFSAQFASAAGACSFVLAARDRGLALLAAEVRSASDSGSSSGWTAALIAGGSQAAVDRTAHELRSLAEQRGSGIVDEGAHPVTEIAQRERESHPLALRAAVLPSAVAEVLAAMSQMPAAELSSAVCAGVVRCAASDGVASRNVLDGARRIVESAGGTVFVERVPLEIKREIDVFGQPRADWAIMRRLKEEFDPSGRLSPGRFAGRI